MERLNEETETINNLFKEDFKLGLDTTDEPNRSVFENIIYWLAKIYMRADWKKIARSKNVYREDVFEHVVKASASQPNIRRVTDKLCEKLGLQSLAISSEILDYLETNRNIALKCIRREPIYFSLKAMELANIMFEQKLWRKI